MRPLFLELKSRSSAQRTRKTGKVWSCWDRVWTQRKRGFERREHIELSGLADPSQVWPDPVRTGSGPHGGGIWRQMDYGSPARRRRSRPRQCRKRVGSKEPEENRLLFPFRRF